MRWLAVGEEHKRLENWVCNTSRAKREEVLGDKIMGKACNFPTQYYVLLIAISAARTIGSDASHTEGA